MSAIEEYRRKLAEIATQATVILSYIADTEKRLDNLKTQVRNIYEEIDDILDIGEIKHEPAKPK